MTGGQEVTGFLLPSAGAILTISTDKNKDLTDYG